MAWPFMPSSSERIWAFLGYDSPLEAAGFDLLPPLPAGQAMPEPVPVYRKEEVPREEPDAEPPAPGPEPAAPFAAFRRLDIRVGRIISVEDHPDADKLYLLKADVGEEEPRQIVAGLKAFYDRDGMQDRPVLVVTNLKPAKIRGIKSTGMLLAADDEDLGGDSVLLLEPAPGAEPGTRYASGFDAASSRIDYKEFQQVRMAVSAVSGGRPTLADTAAPLPDGAPERIILVIDGEAAVPLGDGDGGMATVARPMPDGAGVR